MILKRLLLLACFTTAYSLFGQAPYVSKVWVADNGDGTYTNPVLFADYSDPDVVRAGDDYYMVASSFNCVPGLPILHSRDLVNWRLINYAVDKLMPSEVFGTVQHGGGIWAPCIRLHQNEFYIFYPDPDYGIYMTKSTNPAGEWSDPILVQAGKGLIDPSPFWDEDGKAYLAYAFAGSRAGVKSVLMISRMKTDGTALLGSSVLVFDGHNENPTVEGPKFYKRNGYYYIFAPAGGVKPGWQLALRAKNIFGPYEAKKVLAQGGSNINGPHQGAWVTTQTGEDWFLHFQDTGLYGRVVHLNPMKWIDDWPVIGVDRDGDGCGEPLQRYTKPNVGRSYSVETPAETDEFNGAELGLQWQWHSNPQVTWGSPSGNLGFFRLNCIPKPAEYHNLWNASNLLLQKIPAPSFQATAKVTFNARFDGEEFGLVAMGMSYSRIGVVRADGKLWLQQADCQMAHQGSAESLSERVALKSNTFYLRLSVGSGGVCRLSYSIDGNEFFPLGSSTTLAEGLWIGSKVGFYALREGVINDAGTVDIDWFRIDKY